jgi:hypothetical protein
MILFMKTEQQPQPTEQDKFASLEARILEVAAVDKENRRAAERDLAGELIRDAFNDDLKVVL